MAKSAEDLALMLNVMIGFDPRDSTSLERPVEDYTRDLNKSLAGLKIGLPKEYFQEGLGADVAKSIDAAIADYKKSLAIAPELTSTAALGDLYAVTGDKAEALARGTLDRSARHECVGELPHAGSASQQDVTLSHT